MPNQLDHEKRYTSAQACAAAGITTSTLLNWVSRKPPAILLSAKEREISGKGRPLLFSFHRVMQIALTAALVDQGIQPRPAGMIAAGFVDLSSNPASGWGDGAPSAGRMPGELFPTGLTLLIGYQGEQLGHVVNLTDATKMEELIYPRGLSASCYEAGTFVVVDFIYKRVRQNLAAYAAAPADRVLA